MELYIIDIKNKRRVQRPHCKQPETWVTATCKCGTIFDVRLNSIEQGVTKSCGCFRKNMIAERNKTHGMNRTPTHITWNAMKDRCRNKNYNNYKYYGGRGISYCDRWEKFENFLEDMGERPEERTLDRIDVNGNYCKENCRWATLAVQASNKRNSKKNTQDG